MITKRDFFMIHQYKSEGLSNRAIARRLGIDRKTVARHLCQDDQDPGALQRSFHSSKLDPHRAYLYERVQQYPELSAKRLQREIQGLGYQGGYSILCDYLRTIRPLSEVEFEVRFETAPGQQGQADFACFFAQFMDEPGITRRLWLYTTVLGYSRRLWGCFCHSQDMQTVMRMHIRCFEAFGGAPQQMLYDRMKTAVIDEDPPGQVNYNTNLLSLLHHYGSTPRACRAGRPQTKGKVERMYSYVRRDFYLAQQFDNLEHLNHCFAKWLDEVANQRVHGTTGRVVAEAFEEECASLQPLPKVPYQALLALERKINREGMVAYNGNSYSIPDGTRSRIVELQVLPLELRVIDQGQVIATHGIVDGKGCRVVDPTHRKARPAALIETGDALQSASVTPRPLDFYQAVGQKLAAQSGEETS